EHQKFFSVRNPATSRIERFITVANLVAPDGGAAILAGNRRVLAARLADAKFFWENDLRTVRESGLEGMATPLSNVVFHAKLGSQADRIRRIEALAREIAPDVGADPDEAAEAARIAKADLASEMVFEFPELQGVMGGYYAADVSKSEAVAAACEAHYRPLGPSDAVPSEPVAVAVALADKIDMLTGFWAIDEKPTGSKDPFALRRAALGVIRIALENELRLRLSTSITAGFERFTFSPSGRLQDLVPDLIGFLADRLKVVLRDEGIRHDVIDACFQLGGEDDLVLLVARVRALQAFLGTEDGANLLGGYNRASNILEAEEKKDGVEYSYPPDVQFAEHNEERALFAALDAAEPAIATALVHEDFAAAMTEMAKLRAPVDAFFDAVLVNAESQIVRRNRLCLLSRVRAAMRPVAVWDTIEG
ncbi:MAG: glycine--tRNA ligase subunit beta, partial [Pseudomonadota bacterium]